MIALNDILGKRDPDFNNILKILRRQKADRYTLFEFFLNSDIYEDVTGREMPPELEERMKQVIEAYTLLGYDYMTLQASNFGFSSNQPKNHATISLNDNNVITGAEDFRAYKWLDPAECYDGRLERLSPYLPDGMKFIVYSPGGVLENAVSLVGYDKLCLMLFDDPPLAAAIFDEIGRRLVEYYRVIIDKECVGAVIANDDWGFNTQTMISPTDLRKYVFPYHKQIAEIAHNAGKPVILHSCGRLDAVHDDIILDIKFDGKHSYEDNILPVEQAYDLLHERIAVIGGIDLDFVCRSGAEAVLKRSREMLEKTGGTAYALGTGNSVPEYVPKENYYAMLAAAIL